MIVAFTSERLQEPADSGWIGYGVLGLLSLALGLFFVLALRDLIKESKAALLRKKRGIPRPIG